MAVREGKFDHDTQMKAADECEQRTSKWIAGDTTKCSGGCPIPAAVNESVRAAIAKWIDSFTSILTAAQLQHYSPPPAAVTASVAAAETAKK